MGPQSNRLLVPSFAHNAPAPVTAGNRNLVVAVTGDIRRAEETLAPYFVETGSRLSVVGADDTEEGEYADVYLGEYFADTWGVAEANGLRPYRPTAEAAIVAQWTDPESRWVPLGIRFRSIVINENVTTAEDRELRSGTTPRCGTNGGADAFACRRRDMPAIGCWSPT